MGRHVRKDGHAMANLSRFHPDWGMTPAQHEAAKAERARGDRPFQPKARLRKLAKSVA